MKVLSTLCAVAIGLSSLFVAVSAEAKTWTVDERQQELMQQINEGQKAKELTVKEAKNMRKALADLAKKKAKMKAKSKNALTKENVTDLEADLNKISVDIQKLKLEKRVQK